MKLSFDVGNAQDKQFASQAGLGSITYRERDFESECFDNRTAEVLEWDSGAFPQAFKEFLHEEKFTAGDLLYLRLPATDIASIQSVEAAGFYFIESSTFPYLKLKNWDRARHKRVISSMVSVGDDKIEEVEQIAQETFHGLRFNLDPHIGDERANKRYTRWLKNSYENGEDVCALMHHDSVVGFSLLDHGADGRTVFRLAGVRSDLKNTGFGLMLYASTIARCQDRGASHFDTGISVANLSALNVLAYLGCSFKDPTVVLHYYVN